MDIKSSNPKKLVLIFFLLCLFALAILYFFQKPDGRLHLVFCDVGQGDAILVTDPKGNQILIDGGPDSSVLSCLSGNMPFWDRTLEMVVSTHPEKDHFGGLIEVLKRYQVKKVLHTSAVNKGEDFEAFRKEVESPRISKIVAKRGQRIQFGSGLRAEVFWPPDGNFPYGVSSSLNEESVVLKIAFGNFCAVLAGDVDSNVEQTLLSLGGISNCPVLKFPHHGSATGVSDVFLKTLAPKTAVISVGENNKFGHPTNEALTSLSKVGAKIFRTDKNGEVEVLTDGKSYKVETER